MIEKCNEVFFDYVDDGFQKEEIFRTQKKFHIIIIITGSKL